MEQTLGKRIAEHRKRLKMTQDQLAEHLGITAQAVSKWENDQSCPDITMLPKLAEIFGITTDALLGYVGEPPICEAEVVEKEQEEDGADPQWSDHSGDKSVFYWDSGKRGAIFFALLVLMVGVLTLVSKILHWDVSFWSIAWPCALLLLGLKGLFHKFSFFNLGCLLFGGYYLVENLGIWQISIAGELIFPIIVVLLGISLLADALRKPNKPRFRVIHQGPNQSTKTHCECSNESEGFQCNVSFGEREHRVVLHRLVEGDACVSFGELTVDLTGCQSIGSNCTVSANCSFGSLKLVVPKRFRVEPQSNTSFASVQSHGQPNADSDGVIYLDANVSFGEITIEYV